MMVWSLRSLTSLPAVVSIGATLLVAGATLAGCGTDDGPKSEADTGADVEDVAADTTTADTEPSDSSVQLQVKWTAKTPPLDGKVLGGAVIPGKPGHYLLVGEAAGVVEMTPEGSTVRKPAGVGNANLEAAWVDATGLAFAAGNQSSLLVGSGDDWQLVGEIPPNPPAWFHAIDGDGKVVWAVGDDRVAWRRGADEAWLAQEVSVTEGDALPEGADFVGVDVADQGAVVWIAASLGNDGGALLEKIDGGWRRVDIAISPRAIWRADNGDVWVVGGTAEAFVARWTGKELVTETELQWKLGFRSVSGLAKGPVWAGALKGQLRAFDGKAWSVVNIAPPVGTPKPFAAPSGDIVAILPHAADEWLVVTPFTVYRYGAQP